MKITYADFQAYELVKKLGWNQPVETEGGKGFASGMELGVPVFKIKGKLEKIPLGDPRLRTVRPL